MVSNVVVFVVAGSEAAWCCTAIRHVVLVAVVVVASDHDQQPLSQQPRYVANSAHPRHPGSSCHRALRRGSGLVAVLQLRTVLFGTLGNSGGDGAAAAVMQ